MAKFVQVTAKMVDAFKAGASEYTGRYCHQVDVRQDPSVDGVYVVRGHFEQVTPSGRAQEGESLVLFLATVGERNPAKMDTTALADAMEEVEYQWPVSWAG